MSGRLQNAIIKLLEQEKKIKERLKNKKRELKELERKTQLKKGQEQKFQVKLKEKGVTAKQLKAQKELGDLATQEFIERGRKRTVIEMAAKRSAKRVRKQVSPF